ncbi:MAG: DUF2723 domain-containing protein [Anaerolineales bacterium]|nr:DUF2723 domain-containing protein [Anaerolineales bacterium]
MMDRVNGDFFSKGKRFSPAATAFGLFVLTAIVRIPFRSQVLFNWDSVNYALGIGGFSIHQHRPHPPGYILYIGIGRILTLLTQDPNASLVWISVFSGAVSVAMTYWFARKLFSERDAVFSAVLLLTSPLVWLYDETALNYSVEMMMFLLIGYACFRMLEGESRWAYGAALLLGICGGIRQTTMVVLLPLFLRSLVSFRKRVIVFAVALLSGICLAWFVPLMANSGGVVGFFQSLAVLSSTLIKYNGFDFSYAMFYGGGISLLLFLAGWIGGVTVPRGHRPAWEKQFLYFWLIPNLLVIGLVHMGQTGYILFLLPPLFIHTPPRLREFILRFFSAGGADGESRGASVESKMILSLLVFGIAGISVFLTGAYPLIRYQNSTWQDARRLVETYSPESTIILADDSRSRGFRQISYYLPDYRTFMVAEAYPSGAYKPKSGILPMGWVFQSENGEDNYYLDPDGNMVYDALALEDGVTGILLSSESIRDAMQEGMAIAGQEAEFEAVDGDFYYVSVPEGMHTLIFRNGLLYFQ